MFCSCLEVVVAMGHLQLSLWEDVPGLPALLALVLVVPVLMFPFLLIPIDLVILSVLLCRPLCGEILV